MAVYQETVQQHAMNIVPHNSMGRVNNMDVVVNAPAFNSIRAVKEDKVFVNPKGVFYWDIPAKAFC